MIVAPVGYLNPAGAVSQSEFSVANTALTITLAAVPGGRHVLHFLAFGYNGAASNGLIIVEDGAAGPILYQNSIVSVNDSGVPCFIIGSENTAMVVTLGAGGASIVGRISLTSSVYRA